MLWGAIAQSFPDIDLVASFWNDASGNLLAHRGLTHSLLFDIVLTLVLAISAAHYYRSYGISQYKWIMFFGLQISTHLLVDVFNSYGMGLLEPFSHERFSLNSLFVVDPFFTIWPAISFAVLLALSSGSTRRTIWQLTGIIPCIIYLSYCSYNKLKVENDTREVLKNKSLSHHQVLTTPTPLNNWLWYVIAKTDSGFYVGYHSVFDKKPFTFNYFPQNAWLLQSLANQGEVERLVHFSQGFYTVERWGDTLVFNDLRFGQVVGWCDPYQKFAFHFYLGKKDSDNRFVVQRGRFAAWNRVTIKSLIKRIGGN